MEHNFSFQYKNVFLRPTNTSDLEYLRKWRNDPINTTFLRRVPYITKKQQLIWYKTQLESENEFLFSIIETHDLNRVVGSLSLYNIADGSAEFGRFLIGDPQAHGKKIGTSALIAVLCIAFIELDLNRVGLFVFKNNIPAIKVYSSVGFETVASSGIGDVKEIRMEITKERFYRILKNEND